MTFKLKDIPSMADRMIEVMTTTNQQRASNGQPPFFPADEMEEILKPYRFQDAMDEAGKGDDLTCDEVVDLSYKLTLKEFRWVLGLPRIAE